MFSNLLVVSYITHDTLESRNLEKSLNMYGYEYLFIGRNEKWKGFIESKINRLYNFLSQIKHDLICVIDGYDVICCGPKNELIEKYNTFNSDIVYGGEKFGFTYNCTPLRKYKNISFYNVRKYLNGGFCIGKRKKILKLYKWLLDTYHKTGINDDQKLIGKYANIFGDIKVDLYSKLVFNTITNFTYYQLKEKRVVALDQTPCFIHFPSNSSDNFKRYNIFCRLVGNFYPVIKPYKFSLNLFMYARYILLVFLCLFIFKFKYFVIVLFFSLIILSQKMLIYDLKFIAI